MKKKNIVEAMHESLGKTGFRRITSGGTGTEGKFFAIKAINGDAIFAEETRCEIGDNPLSGDTLLEGDILFAPFTIIKLTSGVVYAYEEF